MLVSGLNLSYVACAWHIGKTAVFVRTVNRALSVQAPAQIQFLPFVRGLTSLKVEGFDPLGLFLCGTIEQLHSLRRLEILSKFTPVEAAQVLHVLCFTCVRKSCSVVLSLLAFSVFL